MANVTVVNIDNKKKNSVSVVAAHVRCRWRSTDRDRRTMAGRCFIQIHIRAGESVFAIVLGEFCV